jgi:hypothetical protein
VRVGLDFDNTIVCYDQVFHQVAVEKGLITADVPRSKGGVRDRLRALGLEEAWIEMQGYVYGARLADAPPFEGAGEFVQAALHAGIDVCVISHKTRHPFSGPAYDLHAAARAWLAHNPDFNGRRAGAPSVRCFFELTKEAKLKRIASERCDWFVDDLPEFLGEPTFPSGVRRVHFDPAGGGGADERFISAASWQQISRIILCGQRHAA